MAMERHQRYILTAQHWLSLVAPSSESEQVATSGCKVSYSTWREPRRARGKSQALLYFQDGFGKKGHLPVRLRVTFVGELDVQQSSRVNWCSVHLSYLFSPFSFCVLHAHSHGDHTWHGHADTSAVSRRYQQASSTGSRGPDREQKVQWEFGPGTTVQSSLGIGSSLPTCSKGYKGNAYALCSFSATSGACTRSRTLLRIRALPRSFG